MKSNLNFSKSWKIDYENRKKKKSSTGKPKEPIQGYKETMRMYK